MAPRRLLAVLVLAALAGACHAPPPPPTASPAQEQVFSHFALARDLLTFVVNGDMERLRVTAEELAVMEPTWGMPSGSEAFRDGVHAAARAAAAAPDPAAAAEAVAEVASRCGACHLASDATLGGRFQVAAPLLDDPGTRHTDYLSWVSRLLWEGLVGPSERMWRTGAGALAGSDGMPAPRGTYVPPEEVARAGAFLRELAVDAVTTTDPDGQAHVLGRVWAVCADCHVQAGVR